MRIYQNCQEMYSETERELWEMGIRYQSHSVQDKVVDGNPDYQTIELPFYAYSMSRYDDLYELLNIGGIDCKWADAEFAERIDLSLVNKNPGTAYLERKALWDTMIHDERFAYTYAERWHEQIPYVIHELQNRPNSRQVIMTMYDRHQDMMNWGGKSRIPCSVSYQFMARNGLLHLLYNQRSCDFKKFFPADVFFSVSLLKHIAEKTNFRPGMFTHVIGSLHVFKIDFPEGVF